MATLVWSIGNGRGSGINNGRRLYDPAVRKGAARRMSRGVEESIPRDVVCCGRNLCETEVKVHHVDAMP